jgi:hypothetical protein
MFVRLHRTAKGPAGKWSDAATGEHGDLLDVIRETLGLTDFRDVVEEARRFLSLPRPVPELVLPVGMKDILPVPSGSPKAARRLFAMAQPIAGTIAETYLRNRGITAFNENQSPALSSPLLLSSGQGCSDRGSSGHDRLRHRPCGPPDGRAPHLARSGTDRTRPPSISRGRPWGTCSGLACGLARRKTCLRQARESKRCCPFGLSCRRLPSLAALSAGHLGAILFPDGLKRLYILRDRDPSGDRARDTLIARANAEGIEAVALTPVLGDFNEDLRHLGAVALRTVLQDQLHPEDLGRFLAA